MELVKQPETIINDSFVRTFNFDYTRSRLIFTNGEQYELKSKSTDSRYPSAYRINFREDLKKGDVPDVDSVQYFIQLLTNTDNDVTNNKPLVFKTSNGKKVTVNQLILNNGAYMEKAFYDRLISFYPSNEYNRNRINTSFGSTRQIVAVMYSGGYDSTRLIFKAIEEGYDVMPFINHYCNYDKDYILHTIIEMQLDAIAEKYPGRIYESIDNLRFHYGPALFNSYIKNSFFETPVGWGYTQQPMEAIGPICLRPDLYRRLKEIWIGFIDGDVGATPENIKREKEIHRIFTEFSQAYFDHHEKVIDLKFPLVNTSKKEIVDYINDKIDKEGINLYPMTCDKIKVKNFLVEINDLDNYKNDQTFLLTLPLTCNSTKEESPVRLCISCEKLRKVESAKYDSVALFTELVDVYD